VPYDGGSELLVFFLGPSPATPDVVMELELLRVRLLPFVIAQELLKPASRLAEPRSDLNLAHVVTSTCGCQFAHKVEYEST
jgi:hypothetical protein